MKRYLTFAGLHHYPLGGWYDFVGDFDDRREAQDAAKAKCEDMSSHFAWWHVVDTSTGMVVLNEDCHLID